MQGASECMKRSSLRHFCRNNLCRCWIIANLVGLWCVRRHLLKWCTVDHHGGFTERRIVASQNQIRLAQAIEIDNSVLDRLSCASVATAFGMCENPIRKNPFEVILFCRIICRQEKCRPIISFNFPSHPQFEKLCWAAFLVGVVCAPHMDTNCALELTCDC